jgi:uncharacterized membrane protein YhiD involved in acid resistance
VTVSGADAVHLVVAVALTYLLGFERDLRGGAAGDRVFALVGAGSGVATAIGAAAGQGRLLVAGVATRAVAVRARDPAHQSAEHARWEPVGSAFQQR